MVQLNCTVLLVGVGVLLKMYHFLELILVKKDIHFNGDNYITNYICYVPCLNFLLFALK
jgi:hypothetical protein